MASKREVCNRALTINCTEVLIVEEQGATVSRIAQGMAKGLPRTSEIASWKTAGVPDPESAARRSRGRVEVDTTH